MSIYLHSNYNAPYRIPNELVKSVYESVYSGKLNWGRRKKKENGVDTNGTKSDQFAGALAQSVLIEGFKQCRYSEYVSFKNSEDDSCDNGVDIAIDGNVFIDCKNKLRTVNRIDNDFAWNVPLCQMNFYNHMYMFTQISSSNGTVPINGRGKEKEILPDKDFYFRIAGWMLVTEFHSLSKYNIQGKAINQSDGGHFVNKMANKEIFYEDMFKFYGFDNFVRTTIVNKQRILDERSIFEPSLRKKVAELQGTQFGDSSCDIPITYTC